MLSIVDAASSADGREEKRKRTSGEEPSRVACPSVAGGGPREKRLNVAVDERGREKGRGGLGRDGGGRSGTEKYKNQTRTWHRPLTA